MQFGLIFYLKVTTYMYLTFDLENAFNSLLLLDLQKFDNWLVSALQVVCRRAVPKLRVMSAMIVL